MNIPYLAIFYSSLCSYIHIHAHTCRYIPNTYTRTCAFIHTVPSMPLHVQLRLLDSKAQIHSPPRRGLTRSGTAVAA